MNECEADVSTVHSWLKEWAARKEVEIKFAMEHASSWFPKRGRYFVHVPPHEWQSTWENVSILAHELGHHRSHAEHGTPYDQELIDRVNAGEDATEEERIAYFAEEERAWALGRELMVQAGLSDLTLYDLQARTSLHGYRVGLKLGA